MNENNIPDELVAQVQALAEDEELYRWLRTLTSIAANLRQSKIGRVTTRLRASGQESLAHALTSLNDEKMRWAVRHTAESCRRE